MLSVWRRGSFPYCRFVQFLCISNKKTATLIAEDTGAKVMQFSSCHNVTKDEFKNGVSYISLMEQNLNALKEALS